MPLYLTSCLTPAGDFHRADYRSADNAAAAVAACSKAYPDAVGHAAQPAELPLSAELLALLERAAIWSAIESAAKAPPLTKAQERLLAYSETCRLNLIASLDGPAARLRQHGGSGRAIEQAAERIDAQAADRAAKIVAGQRSS